MPISAADVAKMMEATTTGGRGTSGPHISFFVSTAVLLLLSQAMGVDRVCCVDLHCGQIQGFFGPRTPVESPISPHISPYLPTSPHLSDNWCGAQY